MVRLKKIQKNRSPGRPGHTASTAIQEFKFITGFLFGMLNMCFLKNPRLERGKEKVERVRARAGSAAASRRQANGQYNPFSRRQIVYSVRCRNERLLTEG
jgi:hypothetical protein